MGIHRWSMDSPHKGTVTRKVFPFDDVIIHLYNQIWIWSIIKDELPVYKQCTIMHVFVYSRVEYIPESTCQTNYRFCSKRYRYYTDPREIEHALRWRHNGCDSISNHQPHDCLLNRLFRRRSKKTLKLRVTGLCAGNSPGPVNSPHKWPVTRKMFPFDDVIMVCGVTSFNTRLHM